MECQHLEVREVGFQLDNSVIYECKACGYRFAEDSEVDYDTCTECLTDIPHGVYDSIVNTGHQPSCSLHPDNIAS